MSNLFKLAWNEVDWKKIESRVFRIQRRIYKAKTDKKITTVHYLQKKIIDSLDGKLLSARYSTNIESQLWIKQILIFISEKNIKLIYFITVKTKDEYKRYRNIKIINNKPLEKINLNRCEKQSNDIMDKAKQFLIKLALEPEWALHFEVNSMGYNLGQSHQDTIKNAFSQCRTNIDYGFHTKLARHLTKFNTKRFFKKLNTLKIIEKQIEKWLNSNIMSCSVIRKTTIYLDVNFKKTNQNIVAALLWNILLAGVETYLNQFLTSIEKTITYFRYLDEVLIIAKDSKNLYQAITTYKNYLNQVGITLSNYKSKISTTSEGIKFLGFQLIIIKKDNHFYKKLYISKESKKFLLSNTRFIIQKNKSVSSYLLIRKLSIILLSWGKYFQYCDCKNELLQMDNKILNQLKMWAFRRKAQGKNKSFLKEKYFPSGYFFEFQGSKHKNNWVLYGELNIPGQPKLHNFLPKLSWIKQKNYIAVENKYSIYNGDYLYWFKRLNQVENEQRNLLQKKFLFEGKVEIYNLFTTLKSSF